MKSVIRLKRTAPLLLLISLLIALMSVPSLAAKPAPTNVSPVITQGDAAITFPIEANQIVSFTLNATDKEKTTLTWTVDQTDPPDHGDVAFSNVTNVRGKSSVTVTYTPDSNYIGSDSFTVTVYDAAGAFDAIPIIIVVSGTVANQEPVLETIGNKFTDELTLLSFSASATDPDAEDTLTFSLVNAPAGAAITPAGAFTWTPAEAQGPGNFTFEVQVSDGMATDSETITVTVSEVNTAPVLDAIGNKTATVSEPLTFTAAAADADIPANTLTFSLQDAPPGAAITSDGSFAWTPAAAGTFSATVLVADGSETDTESFTITVNEASTEPSEIRYVSLGDSIATGTTTPITSPTTPYVDLFQNYLDSKYTIPIFRTAFETDGDRTNELLYKLNNNDAMITAVSNADVITISIGGNNLMQAAKDDSALGGYDFNSFDAAIAESGRADFEAHFPQIMSRIQALNADAEVMVMTIFNPYNTSDASLHTAVQSYLFRPNDATYGINEMILSKAGEFNYRIADVYQNFYDTYADNMGAVTYFYPTDWWGRLTRNPHPNQTGQNIIFNLHKAIYEQRHP